MQYQTCITQASIAKRGGIAAENQPMGRPEPHHVDLAAASRSMTTAEVGQHLTDLAAVLANGDAATALAGIVLAARAFGPPDTVRASEKLCGLGEHPLAERLVADALLRCPRDLGLRIEFARIAERNKDFPEAAVRYRALRLADPQVAIAYLGEAASLRDDGCLDEAAAMLDAAVQKFPGDLGIAAAQADVTAKRGRIAEALEQWTAFRVQFPDTPLGYLAAAKLLRDKKEFAAAEALLEQALGPFASDMGVLTDYAWLAHLRRDFAEAEARWRDVRRHHPMLEAGYIQGARNAIEAGRMDTAEALLHEAAARFPDSPGPPAELALLAARLNRWEEAADRWQGVRAQAPNDLTALLEGMKALRQMGRLQEAQVLATAAEAAMGAACERCPDDAGLFRRHALLAEERQDWVEALRRWTHMGARFGENVGGRLHDLRIKVLDQEIELAQQAGGDLSRLLQRQPRFGPDGEDDEKRTVMMAFESLGGIMTGCEFGAVQRSFGAEPLGLLRWSGMAMHTLIDLLERRFENVGEPATTEIGYFDHPGQREYSIKDLTFGFYMHSHIFADQMDKQTVFHQVTRRMRFLRRKMLDDLTRRDKIFLFKDSVREPSAEEIDRFDSAMRAYGSGVLLIVASANDDRPSGTFRVLRDNVWLGCLDFSGEYGEERAERWLQLCRKAYQRFQLPAGELVSGA